MQVNREGYPILCQSGIGPLYYSPLLFPWYKCEQCNTPLPLGYVLNGFGLRSNHIQLIVRNVKTVKFVKKLEKM